MVIFNSYKIFLLFIMVCGINASTAKDSNDTMLSKVNKIRTEGCYCGRRWMPPTKPVRWSNALEKSAMHHAIDMSEHHFFAHYSHNGENIGQRIDLIGYKWKYVGENLGEGQSNFDEVLQDWLRSRSHCQMLMNENMKEMAVINYQNYWVQHFATPLE
jgi:uncharacterized protein YkwD